VIRFNINANNIPLAKPGIYQIVCLVSGRVYVGSSTDIARRATERGNTIVYQEIKRIGIENFRFEPLAYSIDGSSSWLSNAESEMIKTLNCRVPNGFNVNRGSAGPEIIRAALNSIETQIKRKNTLSTSESLARRSKAMKEVLSRPEVREKISDAAFQQWADPEYRKKQMQVRSDPNYKARRSEILKEAANKPEEIERRRAVTTKGWSDPESRKRRIAGMKAAWADPKRYTQRVANHWTKRK
jgi:group I intron endonuclease